MQHLFRELSNHLWLLGLDVNTDDRRTLALEKRHAWCDHGSLDPSVMHSRTYPDGGTYIGRAACASSVLLLDVLDDHGAIEGNSLVHEVCKHWRSIVAYV